MSERLIRGRGKFRHINPAAAAFLLGTLGSGRASR
jgi:hypothetical protein